jgi:hypothetical protein
MTTDQGIITPDYTPAEAAQLLSALDEGQRAAWESVHEVRGTPEGEARFAAANEVNGIYLDAMWETRENGMRYPAESIEQFTARVSPEAEEEREAG